MAFMFVSCIHLRKVTVSSLLHTDLMFSSATMFSVFREWKLQWTLKSHTSCTSWFICWGWFHCTAPNFRLQPSIETFFAIFRYFCFNFLCSHSGFFKCKLKMHIKTGGWKPTKGLAVMQVGTHSCLFLFNAKILSSPSCLLVVSVLGMSFWQHPPPPPHTYTHPGGKCALTSSKP